MSRYFLLSNAIGIDKELPIRLGELSENNPDEIYPSRERYTHLPFLFSYDTSEKS
jgi:hypothetical protein